MPFNTLSFLFFFIVCLGAYRIAGNWSTKKNILLFFSQIFYAAWNPPFIVLLWLSTYLSWRVALLIAHERSVGRRQAYLTLNLTISLSLLAWFKYGDFLLENFILFLKLFNINFHPTPFHVILPVGISFYTFQAMSYTIDVYRRQLEATISLRDYVLYLAFFPQLVAGPIVRASDLLPQFNAEPRVTTNHFGWGLILVVFGLFQKMVLADAVFAPVSDRLYSQPDLASAWDAWAGILSFSGQIFCDFSGYSTCAIGLAFCFGFHFCDNFRSPYGATGFADFWRRWHVSLSTWLRDYLYVPLGGSHGTTLACYRNLFLTMLIGGLWHGASWMFLLWGALHGTYLLVERQIKPRLGSLRRCFSTTGKAFFTFLVVTLSWIPFRSPDTATALAVAKALFRPGFPDLLPGSLFASIVCALGLCAWHINNRERRIQDWFRGLPWVAQSIILGCGLVSIFLVSGGEPRGFIYFQF